jgi:lysozyme family protein
MTDDVVDRFEICLPYTLKEEGGNNDDPDDPGGRTSRGIIQREYNAYRRLIGKPSKDVWTASDAEVHEIYRLQYWMPHCPLMPAGIDYLAFDMNVNMGPYEATLLLQRGLGVRDDGHIGIVTMDAIAHANVIRLIGAVSDQKVVFYRKLPKFWKYGNGWLNRVKDVEAIAGKMALLQQHTAPGNPIDPAATGDKSDPAP